MEWDSQWEWESRGNPMGMGIKHGIKNGNGSEWETTSMGMGITCTDIGNLFPQIVSDIGVLLRFA